MPTLSALAAQGLSALSGAAFLFIMAAGLSLIFGVLRLLNFAHGSLYMLGAYLCWQGQQWFGRGDAGFVAASALAVSVTALVGVALEQGLFRRVLGRPDLIQLLLTYSVVLVMADLVRMIWRAGQLSVTRPPSLAGSWQAGGLVLPHYSVFAVAVALLVGLLLFALVERTGFGRAMRAAATDREMLDVLGVRAGRLNASVFALGAGLAGLAGALMAPTMALVPGMDAEIIIPLFIVVVIGGLGSLAGTALGALIYATVLSFGILALPRFSLFAVAATMAAVLLVRPTGLLGRVVSR